MIKSFLKFLDKRMQYMRWYDISSLKISMLAFAFWLALMFPNTIWSVEPTTYFIIFIIATILPVYGFYFRKKK